MFLKYLTFEVLIINNIKIELNNEINYIVIRY